ncbi:hypothetical protein EYF80_033294 [Liparis tanakae]|uniref:Uncharacterized protein n=1 Tax=Liparis tanakae TaxID=230148 RepID=A0A4Z2GSD4_9TELE|nr:hypothetical protein EYF80_033294 [Liparis tanakae]
MMKPWEKVQQLLNSESRPSPPTHRSLLEALAGRGPVLWHHSGPERRASESVQSGGSSHAGDGEGRAPQGEAPSEVQEHTS